METLKEFSLEKEMTPIVESWFKSNGFMVKREVITAEGVCDLVSVKFNETSGNKRISSGIKQHLSNDLQVHMWALASSSHVSAGKMFNMFKSAGIEKGYFDSELKKLIEKKFITIDQHGNLIGVKDWFPIFSSLISVELKLSNFQEAFAQAKRYKEFSTQTYIGMPANLTDKISRERTEILEKEGIGLLSVTEDTVQIIIESPKKKYSSRSQFLQSVKISEIFWKDKSKAI